ncbi:MAG: DUF433 domain-containing protein [Bifidobacteriaceae bacterium]|jgi:uncharacterized protein (DUF433 family)|nr:DUF433 domain-containing protein [Bifidobacteriaceae bacterium]
MSPVTLRRWADRLGLVSAMPPEGRLGPRLPFMALAEAQFYRKLRADGLTLRAIDVGVRAVRATLGPNMLNRGVLAHDGTDILVRLAETDPDWTRARGRQAGLRGVIELGLTPIDWDENGLLWRVRLTTYPGVHVTADISHAFGQPAIAGHGIRVEDVLALFKAGEPITTVADEFGLDQLIVERLIRSRFTAAA